MRRKGTLTALLSAVVSAAAIGIAAAPAAAATSTVVFHACSDDASFGCGHVAVPLDPGGAVPGTVSLAIRRELSATGTATTAVVVLAGGPGQAALPFAGIASSIVSDALKTDDLVVFDERGTGYSGALKCSALNSLTAPIRQVIPACAMEIGATHGFYTSDDTVADIEAIRKALGYTKLIIYGTSEGTKVALRYAGEYPDNVAGLILDSVVPPDGPPIFYQSTYQAVPRILRQLCENGACRGISDPESALKAVLRRVDAAPVRTTLIESAGQRRSLKIGPGDIAEILLAGDEDPSLRADFPAAIEAAAGGHYRLLAVLFAHAVLDSVPDSTIDDPLYFATDCEELPFPWLRTETPSQRIASALAAAKALAPGTFGPFSYLTAYQQSNAPACAYWPFASSAPEPDITSLPNVPTLIISGADDLRTPTANARKVAAMIPDAKVVVVPQTGHSVLTTEFGNCARNAVNAFLTGKPIQTRCDPTPQPFYLQPAPAAPSSVSLLPPLGGITGGAGRTARAFELTLGWSSRELSESLFETLLGTYNPAFSKGLGGLYGGYAQLTTNAKTRNDTVHFHHFAYVPGVTITGSISNGLGTVAIGGSRAATGTLVARRSNQFVGKLGGTQVHFAITEGQLTALAASVRR
jgi:pimeloyl-ACP methyl ester carboxylesterase